MRIFNKEDYDIVITTTDNKTEAKILFTNGESFIGIATYHEGDKFDEKLGVKIAKAKAWRKVWKKYSQIYFDSAAFLTKCAETSMDNGVTFHNKAKNLDDYIEKLTR